MQALLDGDIIVYSCGFAAEKKLHSVYLEAPSGAVEEHQFEKKKDANAFVKEHGGEIVTTTNVQPVEYALHLVKQLVAKIMEETAADSYRLFLTGKNNYRDELVTYYKANRDPDAKPVHYTAIKNYLLKHCYAEMVEGQEADDAMGIAQTTNFDLINEVDIDYTTIICTKDKDLDMIVGWHYNWTKELKYFIDQESADLFFYTQMLTGDGTDNIPGLFKLTGKKATRPIKENLQNRSVPEMWEYVKGIYHDCGMDEEEQLLEIGRLLWIRRQEDELWQPPQ